MLILLLLLNVSMLWRGDTIDYAAASQFGFCAEQLHLFLVHFSKDRFEDGLAPIPYLFSTPVFIRAYTNSEFGKCQCVS
jgi:hypothetical protein